MLILDEKEIEAFLSGSPIPQEPVSLGTTQVPAVENQSVHFGQYDKSNAYFNLVENEIPDAVVENFIESRFILYE